MVSFSEWQLKRQLGLGGFGEVLLWENRETGQQIATKSLKENANLSKDEIAKLQQRWTQESEWMTRLQTPFIVRGFNDQIDEKFMAFLTERHAWRPLQPIVMEYCNGGDLRTQLLLPQNTNGLVEFEVREILYALRHAIEFLHTKCRIEHRDLKPDNVVIHNEGGRRLYKLTDFGFARSITENTMLKSIVGTRNYVAPEVLDTAEYKQTVDYWSLGVIAYELICGNLPFIPHKELFDIVTNIRKKKDECIAITEDFPEKRYIFHDRIPAENRMSAVFLHKMETWLAIALDQNYHTRGTRPSQRPTSSRELTFYKELDAILSQKILTIFCIPTLTRFAWEITADMTLLEFRSLIERETGIVDIFCIFPTGHPRPFLSAAYRPIDFFVEEWQHNSDGNSPPVMLYITGPNSEYNAGAPQIPAYIKNYLSSKLDIPNWLLKSMEKSTHYLLCNEQFQLEAFVTGLKEYALTMEHAIFHFNTENKENRLEQYFNALTDMSGRLDQFCLNINAAKEACASQIANINGSFFNEWISKAEKLKKDFMTLESLKGKVNRYYKSGLRRAKEMALNPIFDELKNKDAYKLLDFRRHLETLQKLRLSDKQRLDFCRTAVYDCLGERDKLMTSEHLKYAYSTITSVQIEFGVLKRIIDQSIIKLNEMREILNNITVEFHAQLADVYKGIKITVQHLLQDGSSSLLVNGNTDNSIHELFQSPVDSLIEETMEMMTRMDIDDDVGKTNDLPGTIEQ